LSSYQLKTPYDNTTVPWLLFAEEECKKNHTEITQLTIDFREKGFLYPFQIVILACLIETFELRYSIKPNFINGRQNLNHHLNNI
ncbi:unnamed protein product, partial [Ectocarpus fasciculatus]